MNDEDLKAWIERKDDLVSLRDFVAADLYPDEDAVLHAAIRALLHAHPEYRIPLAVAMYRDGSDTQGWSVGGAAEFARVSRWEMMDILVEHGVEPRIGPATIEEAREEVEAVRKWRNARPD